MVEDSGLTEESSCLEEVKEDEKLFRYIYIPQL